MNLTEFLQMIAPEGVWAILSFFLIFYIIKAQEKRDDKQDEREQKYQNIIADLSDALKDLNEIKHILSQKER